MKITVCGFAARRVAVASSGFSTLTLVTKRFRSAKRSLNGEADKSTQVQFAAGIAPALWRSGMSMPMRHWILRWCMRVPLILGVLLPAILTAACSQTTYKASSYRQTVTTQIEIATNIPAEVRLPDRVVGTTPVVFPFNYEEEVDRQVKTANYWETNPGTAAALTVLSLGLYLPFSVIPAEPTSESRPAGRFVNNTLTLRLSADGFEPLEHILEGKGEGKIVLNLSLKPKDK